MKRLGFLACAALLTVGFFFSSYTVPIAHAAVNENDYNVLKASAKDFDFNFETVNGTALSWVTNYPSKEYLAILERDYSSLKNETTSTRRSLEVQTLNQFIVYLNETIPKSSGSYKSALEATLVVATQKFNYAVSAVQLENGAITSAQHQQNLQNANGAAGASYAERQNKMEKECSFLNVGKCLSDGISWIINNTLLELAGFLVWLTANMFNYAIQIGILDFAKWAPDSLYPIWLIIRQIVSLFIVFVGLYLGFMYILGRDEKFQKYIPWVIVFALFVNFSYPLARTAVDVSNIISLNVYTSAVGNSALTAGITSPNTAGALIMNRLGLQGLVMSATNGEGTGGKVGSLTSINTISGSLLAVAFVLYAAYIFLLATGIMVMRTAALIFLIIASPILFVDSVLPILGEKAQLIRKIFFEQLAVGPVFMVMLALTLKFLEIFTTSGMLSSGGLTGASGGEQTIKTFFNIAMMLVMLHIMITVTKKTSGTIGEYATNAMGKVGGFGLGMATGGAGFLARGTLGRAAAVARDSKWVTNNQDSFIGRRAYNLTNSMANSTFDARNSDVVAGGMKKAGLDSGLLGMGGMSIGSKRTFQGQADKRKKEILDGASRIKTRYERDVYGKDAEGKKILLHKEGDIDTDAEAALKRYNQNIGGGSLFMTKKDKELAAEELAKQATANNQKAKDEQGKLSSENLTAYNSVKKDKEKREAFVSNLKTELASLDKTDPERRGNKSEAVLKTLKEVEKTDKEDKEAFDKNVANVLYAYQKKTGADKDRYLTDQTQEIQEAVRALTQPPTSTTLPQSIQRAAPAARTTSVDIDLTEKSPQTIREEKQKVATDVARTEMKMNDPNRTEAVSSSQSPEIRTPQEVTQKVTSATPLSQTTQDISTTSSAERFAQRRKERLESAQVKAQTEMSKPLETV